MSKFGTRNTATRPGHTNRKRGVRTSRANHVPQMVFRSDYYGEIDLLNVGDVQDYFFTSASERLRNFDR